MLGITAAVSDHGEQNFPTGCFSFQLPGALVVSAFRPCHFIVSWKSIWVRYLASKYHFCSKWLQMSNSLTIDHWNGKIRNFHLLIFFCFKSSHKSCCFPWGEQLASVTYLFILYNIVFTPYTIRLVTQSYQESSKWISRWNICFLMGKECFSLRLCLHSVWPFP